MTLQQRQRISTPTEQLRKTLDRLEAQIGLLEHDTNDAALQILPLFDTAQTLFDDLSETGADLSPETSRFETLSGQFQKKGNAFLRKIGGTTALETLRQTHAPDTERWWWFIDRWLADRKRAQVRLQGKTLLTGVAVFAVLALLYTLFLAPDKATREKIGHQQNAESFGKEGNYGQALDEVNQGLDYAPDDVDLLTMKGVFELYLDRTADAAASFEAAEAAAGSHVDFLLSRAQVYLILEDPEAVLADAQVVVGLAPDSPFGYFYIAQANVALGNPFEAQENFEKAAELASAAGEIELEAMARIQLGYLLQQMAAP